MRPKTPRIQVESNLPEFAAAVAADLVRQGFRKVDWLPLKTERTALVVGKDVPIGHVARLLEALDPLAPPVERVPAGGDEPAIRICLGDDRPFGDWTVQLVLDSEGLLTGTQEALATLDIRPKTMRIEHCDTPEVRHHMASPAIVHAIRWVLKQAGCPIHRFVEDDDLDARVVQVRVDRFQADEPAIRKSRRLRTDAIHLIGDDPKALAELADELRKAGFARVSWRQDMNPGGRFDLDAGPLKDDARAPELTRLETTFDGWLRRLGVDGARYPLVVDTADDTSTRDTVLRVPMGAWRAGRLRPYHGPFFDRFDILVRSDDEPLAQAVRKSLEGLGLHAVVVEIVAPKDPLGPPRIEWNAAAPAPAVREVVRTCVREALAECGKDELEPAESPAEIPPPSTDPKDDTSPTIRIDLPVHRTSDAWLGRDLRMAAAEFDVRVYAMRTDKVDALLQSLEGMGFSTIDQSDERDREAAINYGGAPRALVQQVREVVRLHTGHTLPVRKIWSRSDHDIWINLPPAEEPAQEATAPAAEPTRQASRLGDWLREASAAAASPAPILEVQADTVRVGEMRLPRWQGATPLPPDDPARFAHYCLDGITAQTLVHIATSVARREPCLLEGETSTSKTSSILYLAALLGQPVIRLNLNGQTDTSELIGRFQPHDLDSVLPVSQDDLVRGQELLESETRLILGRACDEGRPLTRLEVQQIMANERMRSHPWRWKDGPIVQAMRRGLWVVLDELNLAEPQILERLNPVLEPEPSLTITENDGAVLGPTGEPVHPAFRIFGTMNPAEYQGRSALSPAWRDRWRAYRFVPRSGEVEYAQMLTFLGHGVHPAVAVHGRDYAAWQGRAPYPALAHPLLADTLARLARFHASAEAAATDAGASGLGAHRKERYVFSRRTLLSMTQWIAGRATDEGIETRALRLGLARYYLERVANAEDRAVMMDLLAAVGLSQDAPTVENGPA